MRLVATVLFLVAAELLLWSGGVKLTRPGPTLRALQQTRLPARAGAVRLLGTVEVLVGGMCLVHPVPASALALSALYLGFTGFVLVALSAGRRSATCGCFGTDDAPPSWLHAAANLMAAGAGIAVLGAPRAALALAASSPFRGIPVLAGLALAAYLAILVMTTLPALFFSYGGRERRS